MKRLKTIANVLQNHPAWIVGIVVALLIGVIYGASVNVPFVMDDIWAIRDYPRLGDPTTIFEQPLLFFRPLMIHLSYLVGGNEPWAYRIVNYLFHYATTMLLYGVVRQTLGNRTAVFAALFYAIHPILIESVIWISAVTYPQYAMFLLAALFTYILARRRKQRRWYVFSVVFHLLSLLSSEKAVVLPVLLVCFELSQSSFKKHWRMHIPYFVLSFLIGISLLVGNLGPRIQSFRMNYTAEVPVTNPFINVPYSVINYLKLIFYPANLTVYHTDVGISSLEYIGYLLLFIVFLAVVFIAYRRSKPVFFWLSFFFITLTPTYMPVLVAWIVAERYVYLGTAGVIVAVSYGLNRIAQKKRWESYVYILVTALLITLFFRSVARVSDFKTEEDLWVATLAASPESPNAHNNMGYVYTLWGDHRAAISEYKEAIRYKPNYADAYHNMGLSFMRLQRYPEAEQSFLSAVKYNPRLWQSHINLANLYLSAGYSEEARKYADNAFALNPSDPLVQQIRARTRGGK